MQGSGYFNSLFQFLGRRHMESPTPNVHSPANARAGLHTVGTERKLHQRLARTPPPAKADALALPRPYGPTPTAAARPNTFDTFSYLVPDAPSLPAVATRKGCALAPPKLFWPRRKLLIRPKNFLPHRPTSCTSLLAPALLHLSGTRPPRERLTFPSC